MALARREARIFCEIWEDDDFLGASPSAQRLYMFLISQKDLSHAGVIPLRASRWARKGAGLSTEDVERDLAGLDDRRFLVVDWDTGEVLVRSLIRRDKVYRQPNVMKAAIDYVPLIESQTILRELLAETARVRAEDANLTVPMVEALDAMQKALSERVVEEPDPTPGNPLRNPSGIPPTKATAKKSRGTGSVTTVTTDSPFPDSPLIPPPAAGPSPPRAELAIVVDPGPEPRTAQQLVAWWIERCDQRPPKRVIGQVAKTIAELLADDFEPVAIRRGIAEWAAKELHPSTLASVVTHVANRGAPIRAATTQPTRTELTLAANQQVAQQFRAFEGGPSP